MKMTGNIYHLVDILVNDWTYINNMLSQVRKYPQQNWQLNLDPSQMCKNRDKSQ